LQEQDAPGLPKKEVESQRLSPLETQKPIKMMIQGLIWNYRGLRKKESLPFLRILFVNIPSILLVCKKL
jgi:hypothetical protein